MACSGCRAAPSAAPSAALADVFVCRACIAARASQPRPRALWRRSQCNGMAPLFLWTAVLAVAGLRLTVFAMPMLPEQQGDLRADLRAADRLGLVPSSILEWYLQQRELQPQPQPVVEMESSQPQFQQVQQFRQWLDSQLARLPAASDPEDPSKALVAPQPKRGNYMALCHFKICNMGRKRSPRIQTQDLP